RDYKVTGSDVCSSDLVAIECGAELGRPAQRIEVHAVEPEALVEAVDPFEIIHQTPQEIAAHRYALGGGALQLRQIVAQVHDAVEIVDVAVGGDLVVGGRAVLADVDRINVPDFRREPRHPIGG